MFDLPAQPAMSPRAEEYAAICLERTARARETTRHVADIAFGPDRWQKLDLYLPPAGTAAGWPTLVFIHGGYWTHGHKEWMGFMAPLVTGVPAGFVSVGYRLAPEASHPAQVEDCAAAVAWVHGNIARYGGDPSSLAIGGHSAGAHLAALMATQPAWLANHRIPPGAIIGWVLASGVYDLTDRGLLVDRVEALLGGTGEPTAASPLFEPIPDLGRWVVAVGERDFPALIAQHQRFVARLRPSTAGLCEVVQKGADHFDASLAFGDEASEAARQLRNLLTPGSPTARQ